MRSDPAQNRLAELMGFHRSRLSHHLQRMEERGLISRERAGANTGLRMDIVATPTGFDAVEEVRPAHAASVRKHLIDPPERADLAAFFASLQELVPPPREDAS